MTDRSFRRCRPRLIVVFALVLLWAVPVAAGAGEAYVATHLLDFEYRGEPAMRLPTAVAVRADGNVFVSDGVNDRILEFSPHGELVGEIRQVGDLALSRPMSVKIDAEGRLWIADTGNARVVARASAGTLARQIVLQRGGGEREPDVTDMAVIGDGNTVWLVDNDNHRLVRSDGDAGPTYFGRRGESPGELYYPFMAAVGKGGEVFVTDVINGRLQVLSESGVFSRTIGTYGLDLGQFYRPKGVACDAEGNVWVADGTLGVVQVLTTAGRLIDVVRDTGGKPFHFAAPSGIALDADGNLYVAELSAGRVRKLRVTRGQPGPATTRVRPSPMFASQARSCTICHIEWMEPFSSGVSTALMEVPANPPEAPIVSRSDTCLSCHDGSVVDSRRLVWQEHGHRVGVRPPDAMVVPPYLPLFNDQLGCRTCHSAHVSEEREGDIRAEIFLRVRNAASELCVSCHVDKARGLEEGGHPTRGMPWPVPRTLIEAGARVGADARELPCQVCHTAHGAAYDHLLVMARESDRMCLTCHDQLEPGMFREEEGRHPLDPKAAPEQAAAVEQLGTKLGPDGSLLCLSCHKLHEGKAQRLMLADELTDSQLCLRCHAGKRTVFETAHDLRQSCPDETNRLGMTADTGGPCSPCHLAHRAARTPEDSSIDPDGGRCITCHQERRCAQAKSLGPINHPNVRCVVCHDPHTTDVPKYLRQSAADLCMECHELAEEIFGAHDFGDRPELVNARGQSVADVGSCLVCHSVHHGVAKPLWGASLEAPRTDREKCTVCHKSGGLVAAKPLKKFSHTLACTSCHNPHGDSEENAALLIVDPPAQNLCLRCHDEHETVVGGPHDFKRKRSAWPEVSLEKDDRCLACHRPHADEKSGLFANGLAEGVSGPDAACLACHPQAAWETDSDLAALHPRTPTGLDPDDEDLPLVPADGEEEYRIGCRTCHNPHLGAGPPTHLVRAEEGEPTAALCMLCHEGREHIGMTGHSSESLKRAGLPADSCKPCHNVHGNPATVAKSLLWGPKLNPAGRLPAEQRCLGCHRESAPAKPPTIATHPEVPMSNTVGPEAPGFLPLFNELGQVDPGGRISCMTCHLPHGRAPGSDEKAGAEAGTLSPERRRAMRLGLRRFVAPNLCNTCHGADGLRRFLYFHNPQRRGGPLR